MAINGAILQDMPILLQRLLPKTPWLLVAIDGNRRYVDTIPYDGDVDRPEANKFISEQQSFGREVRCLAGCPRSFLIRRPDFDDIRDVSAICVRLPFSQQDALGLLQTPPAVTFPYRGAIIAVWRFETPVPVLVASKIEELFARRFPGAERLNFFVPIVPKIPYDHFIDPKRPEDALKCGAAPVRHSNPAVKRQAEALMETLGDYGFEGEIKSVKTGPVITLYEIELAKGTKSDAIVARADDVARNMGSESVRIIPNLGPKTIGVELPNDKREMILFREMVKSEAYRNSQAVLALILGKATNGDPLIVDLATMPHMLVAGTTGSGKSVELNVLILSLLFGHPPEELRIALIDPARVEFGPYKDVPHLLCPVVTDTNKAIATLQGIADEMDARYEKLEAVGAKTLASYNAKVNERLPYIVVVVDEVADLMANMRKPADRDRIETIIQRLAQAARKAGIHLILATQRPSVNVLAGVTKANFPFRVCFQMANEIDSRTIIGKSGAEALLGKGDMLYLTGGKLTRAHGAYVSEEEVEDAVKALKRLGKPDYQDFDVEGDETETPRRGKRLSDARERVRHQIDLLRGEWTSTDLIMRVRKVTGASESIIKQEMRDHPRVRMDRVSNRNNVPHKVTIR
jgi:hypothetical protein